MAGTSNQVRPQWLQDAGQDAVAPWDVFNKNLVDKDLSGLTFKRERYYCSRNPKNSGKYGKDNNIHDIRPSEWLDRN